MRHNKEDLAGIYGAEHAREIPRVATQYHHQ